MWFHHATSESSQKIIQYSDKGFSHLLKQERL